MSETTVNRAPIGKDVSTRRRVGKKRRHARLRKTIVGTAVKPRMSVHRSSRHIHVQVVDDSKGHTLASASSLEAEVQAVQGDKKAKSQKVGELIAARTKTAGVNKVVFDRGGSQYHGRIAALADAARSAGLEF